MGAVDPHARVNHIASDDWSPVDTFGDASGSTAWQQYGGINVLNQASYFSNMDSSNPSELSYLTFKYLTLNPGEVKQFNYVYLTKDAFEVAALNDISVPVLTQPTDIASGSNMLFSALSTQFAILQCTFSVYANKPSASSNGAWYTLGTVSYAPSLNATSCSLYVNTTAFIDGDAQLAVNMTTTGGVFQTHRAIAFSNSGTVACFNSSDVNGSYAFYNNASTSLEVTTCAPTLSITSVSFYREYFANNEVVSTLLSTVTSAPYRSSVNVSDLAVGTVVHIKAVTLSNSLYTASTFTGVVTSGAVISSTSVPSRLPSASSTMNPSLSPTTFLPSIYSSPTPSVKPTLYPSLVPYIGIPTYKPTVFYNNQGLCTTSSAVTPSVGDGSCKSGDILLLGTYIQLGVHNCGSFGSSNVAINGLNALGLVADIFKQGWLAAPISYAGDYFMPSGFAAFEGDLLIVLMIT